MTDLDTMLSEMDKLSERFLSVDRSAQVSQMDAHLDQNDQGVGALGKEPATPVPPAASGSPTPPAPKPTDSAPSAGAGTEKKPEEKPKEEGTTIVPTVAHTVSNMAQGAGMLIRSMKGLEPDRVSKMFGEGYGDKMDEMYESMMKVHEYFKPRAEWTESVNQGGEVLDEKFKIGDITVRDIKPGEEHKSGAVHLVNPTMKEINMAVEAAKQSGHKLVLVQHVKTAGGRIKEEGKNLNETGEMSQADIEPGGDYHEVRLDLERVCDDAGLECKVHPFDVYQGPFAAIPQGKVWTTDSGYYFEPGRGTKFKEFSAETGEEMSDYLKTLEQPK